MISNNETYYIYVGGTSQGVYKCYGEYKVDEKVLKTTPKLEGRVSDKNKYSALLRGMAESLFILKRKPKKVVIFINSSVHEFKKFLSLSETFLSKAVAYMLSDIDYDIKQFEKR